MAKKFVIISSRIRHILNKQLPSPPGPHSVITCHQQSKSCPRSSSQRIPDSINAALPLSLWRSPLPAAIDSLHHTPAISDLTDPTCASPGAFKRRRFVPNGFAPHRGVSHLPAVQTGMQKMCLCCGGDVIVKKQESNL